MFLRLLRSFQYDSHTEKVHREVIIRIAANFLPGLEHTPAPADVVEDENRIRMRKYLQLFEVSA